jgi:hypothetical protein
MKTPADVLIAQAANGNAQAREFLVLWNLYCHEIDDLVDGPTRPTPERLIAAFAKAAVLYSHEFWILHHRTLLPVVLLVTNSYADSVEMESMEGWPARVADVIRCAGNEMICAVALLTGGYEHMRTLSPRLRAASHYEHHDQEGMPT